MTPKNFLFTSESVTEGHPDKVCDQISDAILDEFLTKDPQSRVAAETTATTGMVLVCADRDLTLCHKLTKLLLRHMLLLCDDLHLRRDDTLPRRIHLCCIILHIFSFFLLFLIRDQPSSVQPLDHDSGKQRSRILRMPRIMAFLLNI